MFIWDQRNHEVFYISKGAEKNGKWNLIQYFQIAGKIAYNWIQSYKL